MNLQLEQEKMRQRNSGILPSSKVTVNLDSEDNTVISQEVADLRYKRRQVTAKCRRYSSITLAERLELKKRAVLYKGGKCRLCGYDKCLRALEFHHLQREQKSFSVAEYITRKIFRKPGKPVSSVEEVWRAVKEELEKCELLCANCHREVESGVTILPLISIS